MTVRTSTGSPIITEASAVPIDRTAYTFDNANIPNDNGVIFFEATLYRGEVVADIVSGGVVSDTASSRLGPIFVNAASANIVSYDGTISSNYIGFPLDTSTHKCAVVYDTEAGSKTLYIDGVQGTETSYDGDWGTSPLSLWVTQLYNQRGRNLQVWSGGSYQDKKDKALELSA